MFFFFFFSFSYSFHPSASQAALRLVQVGHKNSQVRKGVVGVVVDWELLGCVFRSLKLFFMFFQFLNFLGFLHQFSHCLHSLFCGIFCSQDAEVTEAFAKIAEDFKVKPMQGAACRLAVDGHLLLIAV